jgi:hypothetical protein
MSLLSDAVKLTAEGFDIERSELFPKNSWAALLATDGETETFSELRRFTRGFIVRNAWDGTRNRPALEIATLEDLSQIILKCSHFACNGQCYAVGEGDVTPPIGDQFTWKIFGSVVRERFEPV